MLYKRFMLNTYIEAEYMVSCNEQTYMSDEECFGEFHDFWEIMYAKHGDIGVTIEENVFELSEGMAIIIHPNEFHRVWSCRDTPSTFDIVTFNASGEGMNLLYDKTIVKFDKDNEKLMDKMLGITKGDYPLDPEMNTYERQLIKLTLEKLLLNLSETKAITPNQKRKSFRNYKLIAETLMNNIDKRLTLTEIAKLCNMSESSLKNIFKTYSHSSVMAYFNMLKIVKAQELIKCGVSMSEVSQAIAMPNQNYFTVFFRRHIGMSPSEYRQAYEQGTLVSTFRPH